MVLSNRLVYWTLLLVINTVHQTNAESLCDDPESYPVLTFENIDDHTESSVHVKSDKSFTSIGDITFFHGRQIEFRLSNEINPNDLFSVVLMKQGTYNRLEPDGERVLKWFVANISGDKLLKGTLYWDGLTLAEYEPVLMTNDDDSDEVSDSDSDSDDKINAPKEYHLLWVFKHVDRHTSIEEVIEDYERNSFPIQTYYDFFCSKPLVEVAFLDVKYKHVLKDIINVYKRMQN